MPTKRPTRRRLAVLTATAVAAGTIPFIAAAVSANAAPTELFFSEYVEGSSNNKAFEVFNGTASSVNLATSAYNVQIFSNGGTTASATINLTGTVAANDAYVVANSTSTNDPVLLAAADQLSGSVTYNGNDAVVLRKGTTIIDVIGQIGTDPGAAGWGTDPTNTTDNTIRRKPTVMAGDVNGTDAFDPAPEWTGYATNTFDGLGTHTIDTTPPDELAPTVTSTTPVNGATGVQVAADLTVTFSEPVDVAGSWFTLSCTTSGAHTATVTGGPTAFTLNPDTDLVAGDSCTLTVLAAQVTDQDSNDPPNNMAADYIVTFAAVAVDPCTQPFTPIPAIQGSGATVALTGTRTTQGVVVADYEGPSPALRGFFIQDQQGDGDAATSDGIFVFEGSNANTVSVGDIVRVTGTAGENQGQSQISVGQVVTCGTGTVSPTDVTFPVASPTFLERYEGMLVRLPQQLSVTEHFQLGRFGQVVVSQGGRLMQPTNVVAPGAPAAALQAENNLRKIIIDDDTQAQNPDPIPFARNGEPLSASNTLRGGDTATGIVGVLNWTWAGNAASPNAWRVRPLGALGGTVEFQAANERPTASPTVGGDTRVAGMNLLNFFNTFSGCTGGSAGDPLDCRGADNAAEFDRQWRKTVAAVSGTHADVVAFMEMENDGYGAASAEAFLVTKLNEHDGPGTWAFINADQATGQTDALGNDAIKVGMLYKPAAVTPVGATAVLNSVEFVNGGDGAPRNRPALAQSFRDNSSGGVFTAVANHLKSKGSACDDPDAGDGQANCNVVRTRSANLLSQWLAGDPTHTGDSDVLILGDLNSYAQEDPITALKNAGFHNLIEEAHGDEAYSYVFDGQWGYLDHALGSPSLTAQVAGVGDWHVNSDEPSVLDYNTEFKTAGQVASLYAPDEFRISDHDPVIVGLSLTNAAPVVGAVSGSTVAAHADATVSTTFTDAEKSDTHTATVAWGDGTTTNATVTEANGSGSVSATHAYAAAGFYTVTVTVGDGFNTSSNTTTVVVYDPAAGFVSGGGWFASPAGAIVANPTFSGKARFTITAEYAAGASVPTGAFTLAFDNSSFAVSASAYDWLVVEGSKATVAGPATVSGQSGYRLEVTVTDGGKKADTIRVVVRDAQGAVAYDSKTQTSNGPIVIH